MNVLREIANQKTEDEMSRKQIDISPTFQKTLLSFHIQANELLRHFWKCLRTTTSSLNEQLQAIITRIERLYDSIQTTIDKLPPDHKNWSQTLIPLKRSLNRAIEKYQELPTAKQ